MLPADHGYFDYRGSPAEEGTRYAFSLDGGPARPDPCSRWQPDGVPGPSAVFWPKNFRWSDADWKGISRADLVFYELHVGTFTPEGTFDAIIPRLADLKALGITAIEIMPVNQFSGTRNWGYDGVLPYAAQHNYGGPQGFQRLVDAAHRVGLAVVLDVVYNHFGPEHNYLEEFGPYLTDQYKTPWGKAVNFDGRGSDAVRDFVLENVRMWLEDFHLDGLRLDAVHAIYDMSARHILQEIKDTACAVGERVKRKIHIVGESDLNDPRVILPRERGGHGLDAQWSDDFHHAVHAYLATEKRGYYADYGCRSHIARALQEPFIYAGDYSEHRGRRHGATAKGIPGDRFVVCLQNHDQVGNRAMGDRLACFLDNPAKLRLAAGLLLLSPHLPLLFMGEEYGEKRCFPFFCSFSGEDLIQAVRDGRKREFADFVSDPDDVPLPDAVETFNSAKLSWSWPQGTFNGQLRQLYADLLALRRSHEALRDFTAWSARLLPDANDGPLLELIRGTGAGALRCFFNLTRDTQPASLPASAPQPLLSSERHLYGGARTDAGPVRELLPFECLVFAGPRH
jgi:maltooligosyltrehalose trehalohydrolase